MLGFSLGLSNLDISEISASEELRLTAVGVLLPAILLILYVRFIKKLPLRTFKINRPTKDQFKDLLKSLGWYMALSFTLLLIAQTFFSGFDASQEQELGLTAPESGSGLIGMFLILCLLVPLSEELLFRGFMFPGLKLRWGWLPAALVSAVLFGWLHGQLNVGLDTAAMGFISARLMHRSDSLTPSILLHSLKNSVAFLLVFVLPLL